MNLSGRVEKGMIDARDEADAFARLRAQHLQPLKLAPHAAAKSLTGSGFLSLFRNNPADLEALLTNLSVLLRAGADIRTALGILDDEGKGLKAAAGKILSGSTIDAALTPLFPAGQAHLGALIAAGEARGDLPSGLEAAAKVLAARRLIRQQLIEALSYPAFVFVTAVAALTVILLVVVPAIAPLLDETGQSVPVYFQIIVWLSEALQWGWGYLSITLLLLCLGTLLAYRYGGLKRLADQWWLDGPMGTIVRGLVYGGFARGLGDALSGGAAITEAIRLSQRSVGSEVARQRIDAVVQAVRQGRRLSEALRQVPGFPKGVLKLCEVGETSGQLGPMLARAGERSETEALSQISKLSKILGPVLILGLGLMIGALMGGVLTALTQIGSVAGA
ncbi:type II secretion system F family protein [Asticcacaulis sp. W401b]|uniref:type II secretion system F family protein n=1 Tax=Asticcacaulis sp. W401b TaxID=3388666 RepID=UPI003970CC94